jgi:hypothetical protein
MIALFPFGEEGLKQGAVVVDDRVWYTLLTSASGMSVYATLGPFRTQEIAEEKARATRAPHYRVCESHSGSDALVGGRSGARP